MARLFANRFAWALRLLAAVRVFQGNAGEAMVIVTFSCGPEVAFEFAAWLSRLRRLPGTVRFAPKPLPIADLLTLPPPARPYPCRVKIDRRGTLLGTDSVVVTFLDGWMHVEGRRTSFSLRPCDVSRRESARLVLEEGGAVEFEPQDWLVAGDLRETNLAQRFKADLKSWMRSDSPEGEPILPPASPHPTGVARAWTNFLASVAFGGLCSVFLIGTHFLWMLGASFAYGAWVALRDVRRLSPPTRALPVVE